MHSTTTTDPRGSWLRFKGSGVLRVRLLLANANRACRSRDEKIALLGKVCDLGGSRDT